MKEKYIRLFWKLPLSIKAKRKILQLRRKIIGYKRSISEEISVAADDDSLLNKYVKQVLSIPAIGNRTDSYVPESDDFYTRENEDPDIFAFYLTQYHPTRENDEWWGKGTTEWNNVNRGIPQFLGHNQPRLPGELGYYDLRIKEVFERQIELAKKYGVKGFCFYHYWFNGRRILEKPLEMFLSNHDLDIPFFYCWANHSWYKRFEGTSDEVLLKMPEDEESYRNYIHAIINDMKDKRYYRINDKPVLMVYQPTDVPNTKSTLLYWRQVAKVNGFVDLYLIAVHEVGANNDYRKYGYDGSSEFHPKTFFNLLNVINNQIDFINKNFEGRVYDYKEIVESKIYNQYHAPVLYRSAMTLWDNTARKNNKGQIFYNATPELYKKWLKDLILITKKNKNLDAKLIFINAWNEWGEGAYLEPDRNYGYAMLNATRKAIEESRTDK